MIETYSIYDVLGTGMVVFHDEKLGVIVTLSCQKECTTVMRVFAQSKVRTFFSYEQIAHKEFDDIGEDDGETESECREIMALFQIKAIDFILNKVNK